MANAYYLEFLMYKRRLRIDIFENTEYTKEGEILQIGTVLTVNHENKDTVIAILGRLEAVKAINEKDLKDALDQINEYYK